MTRGDRPPSYLDADERTTLVAFLDYLRESVVAKLDGLDEATARTPGVDSGTSLLWLVKHLAAVENNWFGHYLTGAEDMDNELPVEPSETIASIVAGYRAAVARSNEIVAGTDLGARGIRHLDNPEAPTLRWVLVHLIEETARHAGHADILREQLDGTTGR